MRLRQATHASIASANLGFPVTQRHQRLHYPTRCLARFLTERSLQSLTFRAAVDS